MTYTSKHKVVFFLSETFAALNLAPVVRRMQMDRTLDVRIINDGFGAAQLDQLGIEYEAIGKNFAVGLDRYLTGADLVVSGKSYAEPSEGILLRMAREKNIPYAMMLPDIGGRIAWEKFDKEAYSGTFLLPDYILVGDPATCEYLAGKGIPQERLVRAGNPYFDAIRKRGDASAPQNDRRVPLITYMDCPFQLDYDRGILPAGPYDQYVFIDEIIDVVRSLPTEVMFCAKPHGQSDVLYRVAQERGVQIITDKDAFDTMMDSDVIFSSYSTTLLEAALLGIPVVSYQPWEEVIRGDVFADRVPVARNTRQLREHLSQAVASFGFTRKPGENPFYNQGRSAEFIVDFLYGLFQHPVRKEIRT